MTELVKLIVVHSGAPNWKPCEMALDAAKKIKESFGDFVKYNDYTIDSKEGKAFNVSSSTNVFINNELLPLNIWTDQEKFKAYIQKLIGEEVPEIKNDSVVYGKYDVVIIGGGPAGLAAGIYCSRARLNTVLLEGAVLGGQVTLTDKIENYPGYLNGRGVDLIKNMEKQAIEFGLEIHTFKGANKIILNGSEKNVYAGNNVYSCGAVIVAAGRKNVELGIPKEKRFQNKGVSYCAVCDANYFEGKKVAVVGGGDTAVEEAIYLSKFASLVYIVHRRDELRATKILQEKAFSNSKIEFLWSHVIKDLVGEDLLDGVIVQNLKNGQDNTISVDGLFVAIGSVPCNDFLKDIVVLNEEGYVKVDANMETSIPGIFAAGDIRVTPLRQVSTAVGDGAISAVSAERYLSDLRREQ